MRPGGSPAAECHRSAWPRFQRGSLGAFRHLLPPCPVGRGRKNCGKSETVSAVPCDIILQDDGRGGDGSGGGQRVVTSMT